MDWTAINEVSDYLVKGRWLRKGKSRMQKGPTASEMMNMPFDPKPWNWQDPSVSSSDPQQPVALDLTNVDLINHSHGK